MSRMFLIPDGSRAMKTWNIFVGCRFDCVYCCARSMALTRLKHSPRYKDGFRPHLVESELTRIFKPGQFIFVSFMGDISFIDRISRDIILNKIWNNPETDFLFNSKNPGIYWQWGVNFPPNLYLGTTIETNRVYGFSKAPPPIKRFHALWATLHPLTFVSIEPIMDFDLDILVTWMRLIKPSIIEVGVDNYHNYLPEPEWGKVEKLLKRLRDFCPTVVEKKGLERLGIKP